MRRAMIAVFSSLTVLASVGCGGSLQNACIEITPMVSQGNALVNDAQEALSQAEVAVYAIRDESVRSKALDAVHEARAALRTAEGLLHAASDACTAPDLPAIFEVFADAWELVRPYLGSHGGHGAPSVDDPMAYQLSAKK